MSSTLDTSVGLSNMGNTCFLNSALQALMRCSEVGTFFLSDEVQIREKSAKKEMVLAFRTLMRDFWSIRAPLSGPQRPSLTPGGFLQSLYTVLRETGDDWHRRGQQSDAMEALQHILEYLHDGMYRSVSMEVHGPATTAAQRSQKAALESWIAFHAKEYSEIVELFGGQTRIVVTCCECNTESEKFEPNMMLKPPIPGAKVAGGPAPTLAQCFEEGFAPEEIADYHCLKCEKKGKAVKREQISRLPPIQLVAVKRFINVPGRGPMGIEQRKVRGRIHWDLDSFDLLPWYAFSRNPYTDKREAGLYKTTAIIEHHGSMGGGHYLMYNRTSDNAWVRCDDSSVATVPASSVITDDSYIAVMVRVSASEKELAKFASSVEALRLVQGPPPSTPPFEPLPHTLPRDAPAPPA
jgi:ubiquitin C-terminal hydrolase